MLQTLPDFKEEFSAKIPALTLLSSLGYEYIPPAQCLTRRGKKSRVILPDVLRHYLTRQRFPFGGKHHALSSASVDKIVGELASPALNVGLRTANQKIYDALTYGIGVTEFIDGKKANPTILLVDWAHPANNLFHVTEEMPVENTTGSGHRIPDIVCFVNGLPWVVIEAKRPDSDKRGKATVTEGISQSIRNQGNDEIPHLFAYSQLLLAINGHEGRYGTCGTPEKFWAIWKEEIITEAEVARLKNKPTTPQQLDALFDHRPVPQRRAFETLLAGGDLTVTDQDRLLVSLLRPDRLLDMVRLYTLFDQRFGKIVGRFQQVFGIKALLERITSFDPKGARNGGVLWHTTGSGKSFTMVFLCKALLWLEPLKRCRVVIVTDRIDLEDQLSRTFASGGALHHRDKRQAMATSGTRLAEQIGRGRERVIFSIINKFSTATKLDRCHNPSADMIVLIDEGHRGQGGENHGRMRRALPNAAFVAFTGTPLLKDDKTENKFGTMIHAYTMQQAVADGTVTPLLYEERIPELNVNEQAIDAWFDRMTEPLTEKQKTDLKRKFSRKGQIYHTEGRIELIAYDISDHFQNFKGDGLRGQLACDSKSSAIRYKQALDKIGKVTSAVVISEPDSREGNEEVDGESKNLVWHWWKQHVGHQDSKSYTRETVAAFSSDRGPDLLIVVDKLLTGFDEPKNTVLYIDKPLKSHNLIQAIARVNRLHKKKQFGYLIDYRGILKELDTTIERYQDLAERTQAGFDIDDLKGLYRAVDTEYKKLPGYYDVLWAIFDGVKNKNDGPALRHFLAPDLVARDGAFLDLNLKRRDDFYACLTRYAKCLKVALQSASFFEDRSFDDATRDHYKETLKMFSNLRKQVREDADESVQYDLYAEDVRYLLDKHIGGIEVREPEGAYLVSNMGKDLKPEALSDDEARAQKDKITGRIAKMIEQDLADDPYTQEYFSKLLKNAIEETKAMFNAPVKQYMLFAELERDIKSRKVADIPDGLRGSRRAQAFFGMFRSLENKGFLEKNQLDDGNLTRHALAIDAIVKRVVAEFSINPQEIENAISRELLPMLFDDLGIEGAQQLIGQVVHHIRIGGSRS